MHHVEERRAVASGASDPKEGWIDSGVGSKTDRSFGQIESLATTSTLYRRSTEFWLEKNNRLMESNSTTLRNSTGCQSLSGASD
jgi:hypothetical protein